MNIILVWFVVVEKFTVKSMLIGGCDAVSGFQCAYNVQCLAFWLRVLSFSTRKFMRKRERENNQKSIGWRN